METLGSSGLTTENNKISEEGNILRALGDKEKILAQFSPEEQQEIERKLNILSSLAYFIGKDFRIPVELNEPGEGWHWDFLANIIRADPKDLLEKPFNYLRFVISHEGGHRRISRTEFISLDVWRQPGFAFMMNAIEDPRDNNFVAENYPRFREQMPLGYEWLKEMEERTDKLAKDKLGYIPRFKQAGYEYIKQWFRESQGEEHAISEDLPDEVREVVERTLLEAQNYWLTYPSKAEADSSEAQIVEYAKHVYESFALAKIWPEFKKLVEFDQEDQKMQELLDEMQQDQAEGGGGPSIPQELKDKLSPEEQKELEEAIEKAIESAKKEEAESESGAGEQQQEGKPEPGTGKPGMKPIDLDSLSPELKQKIKEYIDSLPEDKKEELRQKAERALADFEKEISEELAGKLSDDPEKKAERETGESRETPKEAETSDEPKRPFETEGESESVKQYRKLLEEVLKKDANIYEEKRREVLTIIDRLENELRAIFRARRERRWEAGKKSGPTINIQHRIREIAQGISAVDSRAWQKREKPAEKDYAISLLVDLSGSMEGEKINETFKAVIVLAEVLNRLSIRTEIIGFNDRIYDYQQFGQPMSLGVREKMGGMLQEVYDRSDTGKANWNDDGWALLQASERLNRQREGEKFLFVLSDGEPVESPMHPRDQYELGRVVNRIMSQTKLKLIGLGIGRGTKHVERYYPNSLADVDVAEMAEKLAALIYDAIENYERF